MKIRSYLRDQNRIARSHRRGQTRIAVGRPPLLSEVGLSGIHEAKKYLLGAQIGLHQIAECGTVRTRPSQLAFVLGHSLDVVIDGATRADDAFAVQSVGSEERRVGKERVSTLSSHW